MARKDTLEDTLLWEVKLDCNDKAHQATLEKSLAEKNGTLSEQTKTPLKLVNKKICSRRRKSTLEQSCNFQSLEIWSQRKKQYSNEKLQINTLVVKSFSESIFKRFRKSAVRENFNLKRDPQMRKSHSN